MLPLEQEGNPHIHTHVVRHGHQTKPRDTPNDFIREVWHRADEVHRERPAALRLFLLHVWASVRVSRTSETFSESPRSINIPLIYIPVIKSSNQSTAAPLTSTRASISQQQSTAAPCWTPAVRMCPRACAHVCGSAPASSHVCMCCNQAKNARLGLQAAN